MSLTPEVEVRQPRRRVALYGGAFDPPHWAHLFTVTWLLGQVDEVWLVPTAVHAFGKRMAPFEARVQMLEVAIAGFDRRRVSVHTVEVEREGPSLTYDTLELLSSRHADRDFAWVVGADNLTEASRWYRFDDLVARWPLYVLGRPGHEAALARLEGSRWATTGPTLPDVSSTTLRAALSSSDEAEAARWLPSGVLSLARTHYTSAGETLPSVFLVGRGRAASCLAAALREASVPVVGQWSRRDGDLPRPPLSADVILIAVPDGALRETSARLAETGLVTAQTVVLHLAARLGREVLSACAASGASTGSMHPLQSLSDPQTAAAALRGAAFATEGDPKALDMAARLVAALGGRAVNIPDGGKASYHASAVYAGNFTTTLLHGGCTLLQALGFSEEDARALLLPLMRGTLEQASRWPPAQAMTGPFARFDLEAVAAHLLALKQHAPSLLPVYAALARASGQLLGYDETRQQRLDELLAEATASEEK
ncbi:MAG: DUF2520 domain-containing protein [Myxococcales bacterium]|nr:DUF2520 domain-containing protein [Myxococcales bacterium]